MAESRGSHVVMTAPASDADAHLPQPDGPRVTWQPCGDDGPVYGLGFWFPNQDPCREYREEWLFGITDLEPIEPEVDFGFPLARFWRSVGHRNRSLDHHFHSLACFLSPQQRSELPEKNENSPLWPYLHRECECLPPVGFEDKCYDTEVDASWNRIWDLEHQIADELRVMTTDQHEAEAWFHLEPDQQGRGSYGGYREGERPPHVDTQGRGRFTVSFCMEPPVWARAILTQLGLTRQSSSRPTSDGAWTVWPEFANNVDPDQDPAIPTMAYDDLVDLWVTWPLLDFRGPFKASVPEELVAAIAGLAEVYHNTPPAERATAVAVVNELYALLRTLPLEGVPASLPPGFVPNNPDFIYDLFIRGSE